MYLESHNWVTAAIRFVPLICYIGILYLVLLWMWAFCEDNDYLMRRILIKFVCSNNFEAIKMNNLMISGK